MQPRMIQHILGGEPKLGRKLKHVLYQFLRQAGYVLPVLLGEVVVAGQDAVKKLLLIVILRHERWIAAQEDV